MLNPRVANRYAKSLVDVAGETNQLETVQADMKLLRSICRQSKDFAMLLRSPVISADKKMSIWHAVLGDKVSALTNAFVGLLVNKNREASLPEIADAYLEQYNKLKGIRQVKITTAAPVSDELVSKLVGKLKEAKNVSQVEVETAVDPSLIGGYKMQMGDFLVDNSISRDLNDVKMHFLNNDYMHRIR